MTRYLVGWLTALLALTVFSYWHEISRLMLALLYAGAIVAILALAAGFFLAGWYTLERLLRMVRAARIEAGTGGHLYTPAIKVLTMEPSLVFLI